MADTKVRAPRNRTLSVFPQERADLTEDILRQLPQDRIAAPLEGIVQGDYQAWIPRLPLSHVDLLFLDPPYNLDKEFNGRRFARKSVMEYTDWLIDMLRQLQPVLKQTATIYICGDWFSSPSIFAAASECFVVRNRITWEREKGRGAKTNWKNASEDIWFCTASDEYTFNVDAVKLRRKVLAPYTDNGRPKDWTRTDHGGFRDTHPSNLWTDISVPFWSMPENTDHPTQKSEKFMAKLILASTNPGDFVLDPFLGSGTTTAVAMKLRRKALGIEIDGEYCLLAAKRLRTASHDQPIQGFTDGVFWERNTLAQQRPPSEPKGNGLLF